MQRDSRVFVLFNLKISSEPKLDPGKVLAVETFKDCLNVSGKFDFLSNSTGPFNLIYGDLLSYWSKYMVGCSN